MHACRFLRVSPTSPDDLSLLTTVLRVLRTMTLVSHPQPQACELSDWLLTRDDREWLLEVLCGEGAVCLQLPTDYLQHTEQSQSQRYKIYNIIANVFDFLIYQNVLSRVHNTMQVLHYLLYVKL